jgi:hypothetical protein
MAKKKSSGMDFGTLSSEKPKKRPRKKGGLKLHLKKGALHKTLGIKQGNKIPASKLVIKKGMSALEKKRIQFAINAKKWKH